MARPIPDDAPVTTTARMPGKLAGTGGLRNRRPVSYRVPLDRLLLVVLAAAVGGVMNSIAGGGTLVTFPALVALGLPPRVANATSTVALWPGAVSSMFGYRGHLSGTDSRGWLLHFTVPSLVGGAAGGWLLLVTSPRSFDRLVPFLVLGATILFMAQPMLLRRFLATPGVGDGPAGSRLPLWLFYGMQFGVGVYGGYFGAGIGIMMLATLGLMGLTNIHQMNGIKNWGGLCMNAVAATLFAVSGIVNWPVALAMAVGGLLGGYAGSRLAQRVGQTPVRHAVVGIGLASFVWLFLRAG
jgi:uncharacterized protein